MAITNGVDGKLRITARSVRTRDRAAQYVLDIIGRSRATDLTSIVRFATLGVDKIRDNSDDLIFAKNKGKIYGKIALELYQEKPSMIPGFISLVIQNRVRTEWDREDFLRGVGSELQPLGGSLAGKILAGSLIRLEPSDLYFQANLIVLRAASKFGRERKDFLLGAAARFYPDDPILRQKDLLLKRLEKAGFWERELVKTALEQGGLPVVARFKELRMCDVLLLTGKDRLTANLRYLKELKIAIGKTLLQWFSEEYVGKFFREADFSSLQMMKDPETVMRRLNDILGGYQPVWGGRVGFRLMLIDEDLRPIFGGANYILDAESFQEF